MHRLAALLELDPLGPIATERPAWDALPPAPLSPVVRASRDDVRRTGAAAHPRRRGDEPAASRRRPA